MKSTFIKGFLFLLLIISFRHANAQQTKKEVGIGTFTFEQFIMKYKFGNEKRMFRVNASISGNNRNVNNINLDGLEWDAGLNFGIEFPKKVNEKLSWYYGFQAGGLYGAESKSNNYQYSVRGESIFGFYYYFNDVLKLGAEITPGLSYRFSEVDNSESSSFRFNIDRSWAEVYLGFEF